MLRVFRRARAWAGVDFNDPHDRIEAAMVRVLFLGGAGLMVVGLTDLAVRRTLDAVVLPIGAGIATVAAHRMNRSGRARPRTILVIAALLAVAYVGLTAWQGDTQQLRNESGMVVVVSSGVLAIALGGRWQHLARIFWLASATAVVVLKRAFTGDAGYASVMFDAATVIVVIWMAFVTVVEMRDAAEKGRQKFQRLVDFAPVGVAEVDFRELRRWLGSSGYESVADIDAEIDTGGVQPGGVLERIRVVVLNEHARGLLVVPADQEAGSIGLHDILVGGDRKASARWATAIAFGMTEGSVELDFPNRRGVLRSYVVRWNAQSQDLRDVIFTIVDFTAQKRAETVLAEQIRSKDEFIASVSHELRTPLTAVVGLVDELANPNSSIQGADERQELLEIVAAQSRDVAHIVEDLLVAARAAGGSLTTYPESFDIVLAIRDVLHAVHADVDTVTGEDLMVHADPARTRQIVRNLVTNALRYGTDPMRLIVNAHEGLVVVEMRDAGDPIAQGKRVSMFRPYERAHEASASNPESVGLGLSVSRTLARHMGGDLVYEHDGSESIFRLTLQPADRDGSRSPVPETPGVGASAPPAERSVHASHETHQSAPPPADLPASAEV
jgi:signal transduction histidine kinase